MADTTAPEPVPTPTRVVVVGAGMVAQRFVEALVQRDTAGAFTVTVLGEEAHPPYDRVALTSFFGGAGPAELALGDPTLWEHPRVRLELGAAVTTLDRDARTVTTADGTVHRYDELVLATGSSAFVPPIPGADLPGVFVYRTLDDVAALQAWVGERAAATGRPVRGAVIGGGLLGLEAAGALQSMGARSTVIEFAPRMMAVQVDEGAGQALERIISRLGIDVRTSTGTTSMTAGPDGAVATMTFTDESSIDVDVVVVAAGIRPRDELARTAGLPVGPRGGLVVDDRCLSEDEHVSAVGEVACIQGSTLGLVAPGYTMAEITADRLLGGEGTFPGADMSTKLKLLGVDVASFGDAFATTPGALEVVYADPGAGVYKKLVVSDDAEVLLGGILVGDASAYASLRPMVGRRLGVDPAAFLLPEGTAGGTAGLELPDEAVVCSCNNVTAGQIRCAVSEQGACDLAAVKGCTRAGTSCGSCLPLTKKLMTTEMEKSGLTVSRALCEHFEQTRAELYEIVRVTRLTTFSEIISRHGRGRGCDICKPVVASILASQGNGHILSGEQSALQDTNDHVLANLQKDGSYSVVPRIAGGEVTPEGLIAIGEVARDFGLYTKITGGQRIDLFGVRLEQLPSVWKRLIDAGFESGHAYGKSLRTVKSCVGSTWCRYGVQDSVGLAVALELRYRGLRSPHKIKLGVSGCARECAEARGKDVGVIATDQGWNLYVGGNGGATPRHAQLLAGDLDTDTLVRTIDRFLMYYVRSADRLQRTAVWMQEVEGGLDHVRDVVLGDSLGIGADLDEAMAHHVEAYGDEWAAVLADPEQLRKFSAFVNAPDHVDEALQYVPERGQIRPATDTDRSSGAVLIAGADLEVRR
ncbi:nitrite reductase large subunit NirB [Auraticoccus monumenti]|uniref:assimilatory sulfite reductase (ferredoxin) n=1 Tax=Auraticoccus monumenti TaxID=675864 RepID=A0A1G7DIE4_9ACTN|nr:nitrite reductase large subunit NirB [Auraticoccus monumenti]SDE51253.1 assimilatory nitrite reductase (NAD(P)H) large subunit precursor [Auraticoccus monumenti]